jgi:anthranilate phosphoribosyltransferase
MENNTNFASRVLKDVIKGRDIAQSEVEKFFRLILDHKLGIANDTTFGAFFAALQTKGPTVAEILGLTNVVLNYDRVLIPYDEDPENLCGIVGSGKDDLKTFNVSTCAAIVAAACGVKVVKNGSRSESSVAGTTDVLEKLGFPIHLKPEQVTSLLEQTNFTFCDAEPYFPRMKKEYVGKFLFPHPLSYTLSIASGLRFGRIVFGISFEDTELVADVISGLDFSTFMIVAGHDETGKSLDEISTVGPTKITQQIGGTRKTYTLRPTDLDLKMSAFNEIKQGDSVAENAEIFINVLTGKRVDGALDIVALNTAALLLIAGKVTTLLEGIQQAKASIKLGDAYKKFLHITQLAASYE